MTVEEITAHRVLRDGRPLHKDVARILRGWRAVKGWIVSVERVSDHEGPDFHITVAWDQSELRIEKLVVGHDSYHWAVSYPEHFAWFHERIKPGQPITVLVEPRKLGFRLFGQCEPFVVREGRPVFAAE